MYATLFFTIAIKFSDSGFKGGPTTEGNLEEKAKCTIFNFSNPGKGMSVLKDLSNPFDYRHLSWLDTLVFLLDEFYTRLDLFV